MLMGFAPAHPLLRHAASDPALAFNGALALRSNEPRWQEGIAARDSLGFSAPSGWPDLASTAEPAASLAS